MGFGNKSHDSSGETAGPFRNMTTFMTDLIKVSKVGIGKYRNLNIHKYLKKKKMYVRYLMTY